MKKILFLSIIVMSLVFVMSCGKKETSKADLKTKMDSVSYVIGTRIGRDLKTDTSIKFSPDAIISGLRDGLNGKDSVIFKEVDKQKIIESFQHEMMLKQQEKMKQASEPNKKKGMEFLAENKKKEGVVETASGLQYKVVKEGKGKKPIESDFVVVHYEGKLIDGRVFDSSYERKEPAKFGLSGVIKGWSEGLQLMTEGSKYELYIPSDLAYGDMGNQMIPGGSTLVFTVELVKIENQQETKNKK